MKKIKIAYLGLKEVPSNRGTDRVVENIISCLDKSKFDITVYCMKGHVDRSARIEGVNLKILPTIPIKNVDMMLYLFLCSIHALFCRYDVIHLHNIDGAFIIPILNLKYKKKFIGTTHGRPQNVDKWGKRTRAFFKLMEKWFAKYSNVITSVSKPLADTFLKEYGSEVVYIPNGIHLGEQVDAAGAEELLEKHEVEEKYILFASGRIIPIKGLHDVLEAAGIINLKEQLVILGDMDQVPDYKLKLEEQMKSVNSKHLGFINSKPLLLGLISKTELFIFPSTIEAMSMMLLEAASVKVPIICSDIPENKAVFDETEVLFFKAGDPNDLAEKLKWANSNPDKMKELSGNAYQTLKEKYTWDKVVLQYEDLYENLNQLK